MENLITILLFLLLYAVGLLSGICWLKTIKDTDHLPIIFIPVLNLAFVLTLIVLVFLKITEIPIISRFGDKIFNLYKKLENWINK